MVAEFPKSAQTGKRGKPNLEAALAEVGATVPSQAAERVKQKTSLRKSGVKVDPSTNAVGAQEIPIESLIVGRNPRVFTEASRQASLVDSIKIHGVLQPIIVRPISDTQFQIIAGHRRFAAAKSAKLKAIPAFVKVATDEDAFVQALVENLQREDLNPLDEAKALKQLIDETGWTQEVLGKKIGKTQSAVAKAIGLLTLDPVVQEAIEAGTITPTHGVSLVTLEPSRQREFVAIATTSKLTTKDLDEQIRKQKEEQRRARENETRLTTAIAKAIEVIGAKVAGTKGLTKSKLVIVLDPYGFDKEIGAGLTEAGWTVQLTDKAHDRPQYSCECVKVTFSYDDWRGLSPVCVVDDHYKSWKKQQDAARQKASAEAGKKLDRARNALSRAIRSEDGKGILNIDGQRFTLYWMLNASIGYSYGGSKKDAFLKRHRGDAEGRPTNTDVLEAVYGLSEKDLGEELAKMIVGEIMVNVWGDEAHTVTSNWYARQVAVDQFGLEPDVVYGVHEAGTEVIAERERLGLPITKEQKAKVAERQEREAAWQKELAARTSDVLSPDHGEDDEDDDEDDGDNPVVGQLLTGEPLHADGTTGPISASEAEVLIEEATHQLVDAKLEAGEIVTEDDLRELNSGIQSRVVETTE